MRLSAQDLKNLRPSEKEAVSRILSGESLWAPQNKPQWQAYLSRADCLFLGGASGGGKTQLLLGLSLTAHQESIIFRREYKQLVGSTGIVAESAKILQETDAKYNAHEMTWRNVPPKGINLDFGAVKYEVDVNKYRGRPHDFIGFDELTEFCLVPETEVLTESGWKLIADVDIGEKVFSISVEDKKTSYKRVMNTFEFPYEGELIEVDVSSVHYKATAHHKILLERQNRSEYRLTKIQDFPAFAYHPIYGEWEGNEIDFVEIPEVYGRGLGSNQNRADGIPGDDYVEFMGWYLAEGWAYEPSAQVSVSQIDPPKSLEDLMLRFPYKATKIDYDNGNNRHAGYKIFSRQLYEFIGPLGNVYTKRVPKKILNTNKHQLQLFLDAFCAGDGHYTKSGSIQIGLANEGLIDDLQEIATKLGYRTVKSSHKVTCNGKEYDAWWLHIYTPYMRGTDIFAPEKKRAEVRKRNRKKIPYRGNVHCIEVEHNHTFLARYGGKVFWSGNSRYQFEFLQAWARTIDDSQRVRVVATGNPPTTPQGKWVIDYWRPWLDSTYKNPAKPGELRYFVNLRGRDTEVDGPEEIEGLIPQSRTFIPATVYDNPYYGEEYVAQLQALPEELRRAFLEGDFDVLSGDDDPFQLIKYDWVRMAQERWREMEKPDILTHVGVDVARGGKDYTVFAPRYNNYIDELLVYSGSSTKRGNDIGVLVVDLVGGRDPIINVDCIGVGGAAFDYIFDLDYTVAAINFSNTSNSYDQSGRFKMRNKRAEFYWKLREALDPDLGGQLALPADDSELLEELTSMYYTVKPSGISIESKDKIKERLGRSPDRADAVAYSMGERPIIFG